MTNNLIDKAYFNKRLVIGQSDDDTVEQNLNEAILTYESDLLLKVLGYNLYKAFYTEMKDDNPTQRMLDLAYGKIFNDTYGNEVKYFGLLQNPDKVNLLDFLPTSLEPVSPIAKYVYYHYERNRASNTMGQGQVITSAINVDSMAWAMNSLDGDLTTLYLFLDTFKNDYPEWVTDHSNRYFTGGGYNSFNLNYL